MQLDPRQLLTIEIVDPQGRPAIDAEVRIAQEDHGIVTNFHPGMTVPVFGPQQVVILASKGDWKRRQFVEVGSQPLPRAIVRLRVPASLTGQVSGLTRAQLKDLSVNLHQVSPRDEVQVKVDEEGRLSAQGLVEGLYQVTARVSRTGHYFFSNLLVEAQDDQISLDVDFQPGIDLTAQMLGDGDPLYSLFELTAQNGHLQTGGWREDGVLQIEDLPAGSYLLRAFGKWGSYERNLELPEDADVVVDLPLGELSGRVADSNGNSLSDVSLRLASSSLRSALAGRDFPATDYLGRFQLSSVYLAPDSLLVAAKDGYEVFWTPVDSKLHQPLNIELRVEGQAELHLGSESGDLPEAVNVAYRTPQGRFVFSENFRTQNGVLHLNGLRPGENHLLLRTSGWLPRELSVRPGTTQDVQLVRAATLQIKLSPGSTITPLSLTMTDGQGRLHSPDVFDRRLKSWPLQWGPRHIPLIPPGSYDVRIRMSDGSVIERSVDIRQGRRHKLSIP